MKEIMYFKLDEDKPNGYRLEDGITINDLKSLYLECQLLEIKEITNNLTKDNREESIELMTEFPSFEEWLNIQAQEHTYVSLVEIEE